MKVAGLSWCKALPDWVGQDCHWAGRLIGRGRVRTLVLALPLLSLGGCSEAGAPTLDIFGAFFPAWLLCAVLGIFVALGARTFFAARNLIDVLPFQLLVCTSLGVIFALLVWLICFGR
jgi:YtcA family